MAIALDAFTPGSVRDRAALDLSEWLPSTGAATGQAPAIAAPPNGDTLDVETRLLGYVAEMRLPRLARLGALRRLQHNIRDMGDSRGLLDGETPADLLVLALNPSTDPTRRSAALFTLGFMGHADDEAQAVAVASMLDALARNRSDEASWTALQSLALLDRDDRPASTVLADLLREQEQPALAALTECVGRILGDERCLALIVDIPRLLEEPPPISAGAPPEIVELAKTRRAETEQVFRKLLLGQQPPSVPLLLFAATSLMTEPGVRTVARACAFDAIASSSRSAIRTSLPARLETLLDSATDPRARELLAWSLRYVRLPSPSPDSNAVAAVASVAAVAAALDAVARSEATPCHVRGVAIESLVLLGEQEQAADLLVLAGGGALPRPPLEDRSIEEIRLEPEYRLLAQAAWDAGFPDLGPILLAAHASLGTDGVRRALLLLATGREVIRTAGNGTGSVNQN
jgi:hypothetical protein